MELRNRKKMIVILTALAVLSMAAGCSRETKLEEEPSSSQAPARIKPSDWVNELTAPETEEVSDFQVSVPKENKEKMNEEKKKARDIVAWLNVPNTTINEAVVQYKDDFNYFMNIDPKHETYYERRNIYGAYSFEGCTFMDYTCDIKKGTKADMPENTILYAHHLGNPKGVKNDPNSGGSFAPLLNFRDKAFAEKTPYIYLTTESEDLVYQVFAVSDIEAVSEPLEYNYSSYKGQKWDGTNFKDSDFMTLIKDLRERSWFDYKDVTVTDSDKILTLSTCTYDYGYTYAQNHSQRFIVVGKLVNGKNYVEKANISENTDRKLTKYAR